MNQQDYKKLALLWAPIHYQYAKLKEPIGDDAHFDTKVDLVIPVNFDAYLNKCKNKECNHPLREHESGDCKHKDTKSKCQCKQYLPSYSNQDVENAWNTKNSDKRLDQTHVNDLIPVAYYSIATTKNHYFILYSFYHAHDPGKHINDMEGCMVIVERKQPNDELVGMITVAHDVFPRYSYHDKLHINNIFFTKNAVKKVKHFFRTIDVTGTKGIMEADDEHNSSRSLTQQESQGHGLYALGEKIWTPMRIWRWFKSLVGIYPDFIVYYPSESAIPYSAKDLTRYKGMPHSKTLYYELVDIHDPTNGLIHRIPSKNTENSTFMSNGKFHGNKANPPWKWFEKNLLPKPGTASEMFLWKHPSEIAKIAFEPTDTTQNADFLTGNESYVKTMDDIFG